MAVTEKTRVPAMPLARTIKVWDARKPIAIGAAGAKRTAMAQAVTARAATVKIVAMRPATSGSFP